MRDLNDDAARRALHTLVDEPAPPVTTTLDQVLRRGRRRVLVQRAGAVAGVMAVVAAIGVSAVLLRPGDKDSLQVAITTSESAPTAPSEPSSAATGPPSTATLTPLPGWEVMRLPTVGCDPGFIQLPPEPEIAILPQTVVEPSFVAAVSGVIGQPPEVTRAEWNPNSPKQVGPRGYLAVELPMPGGNGQVQLEVIRYGGTPRQIADASLATYGNCEPPMRKELGDGTILQMYPTNGETHCRRRGHCRSTGPTTACTSSPPQASAKPTSRRRVACPAAGARSRSTSRSWRRWGRTSCVG